MHINQKPLTRRKSIAFFKEDMPENVDEFWKQAEEEIPDDSKIETFAIPESSNINDSNLKFKKEFDNKGSLLDEISLASTEVSNHLSSLNEPMSLIEEISNPINFPIEIENVENPGVSAIPNIDYNPEFNNTPAFSNNSGFFDNPEVEQNNSIEFSQIKQPIKKIKPKPINLSKKNFKKNDSTQSFFENFKNNKHIKLMTNQSLELAVVNLQKEAFIKNEVCTKNMLITVLKGSINVEYEKECINLKNGSFLYIKKERTYSIDGVASKGSVFSVVYVE